ncbi:MAG: FAD synthetase family protein [Chloroflexi bacterium]|nr:FAD synthetase family protein [Chloroflexota bacterium]
MTGRPAVVTVGNFDGVHVGHQYMLRQVVDRARALGMRSLAVTFDPDPQVVLRPDQPFVALTELPEKLRLLRELGLSDIWVCPFTPHVAAMGPAEFIAEVQQHGPVAELWVGSDFALGRDRAGTIPVLVQLGAEQGWGLHVVPPFRLDGTVVSSSRVRAALSGGDAAEAARLLGRASVHAALQAGPAGACRDVPTGRTTDPLVSPL